MIITIILKTNDQTKVKNPQIIILLTIIFYIFKKYHNITSNNKLFINYCLIIHIQFYQDFVLLY